MTASEDSVKALRDALKVSPDNMPLRLLLADSLSGLGRFEEAEQEYSLALAADPNNEKLQIGLASAFYSGGKYSHALVITEDLLKKNPPPAKAFLLHARLLLNDGKLEKARQQYREAISREPDLVDASLCDRLGVSPDLEQQAERVPMAMTERAEGTDLIFEDLVERVKITFEDVGGMEEVKDQVRMKIIHPLTNPELFKAYGKKVGGGILMYGPPGCGKTYLARATAGEIKAGFISVGINDVLDMWMGNSERNLHEIFEQARRNAPCVLFFDEVDALAASRSDLRHSSVRHVINQFLTELDGVQSSNEGVLILAATNAPWHLDSAFRRPGRFDRLILVPPPDAPARASILRVLLRGKPIESIDFDYLAKKTEKYSGADLMAVIETAVEHKLEKALKTGKTMPITSKDLEEACRTVKPSTTEWLATAKNYATYSNQGGVYDEILKYLKF